jgi:hypothetical protein
VAQGAPGKDGMYRYRVHPELIEKVYGWARQKQALLFLDVQIGKSSLEEELKVLVPYLQRPDVHLGLDPEFAMTKGGLPGKRVGTYDASHINYASGVLADLVTQHKLPPKVLVIHRFTGPMVTNVMQVRRDPRVQVVIDMDGWGPPYGKRATWSRFIYPYPLQYTGFKLFYHNDTKAGHPLMKPRTCSRCTPTRSTSSTSDVRISPLRALVERMPRVAGLRASQADELGGDLGEDGRDVAVQAPAGRVGAPRAEHRPASRPRARRLVVALAPRIEDVTQPSPPCATARIAGFRRASWSRSRVPPTGSSTAARRACARRGG